MALNQNQFTISTLQGTMDSGGSGASLSVEFYSATSTDVITPGEAVVIASTPAVGVTRVQAGVDVTSAYRGVILTNPLADSFGVSQKCEMAIEGAVVMMTASAAITAGAAVQYDPVAKQIATLSGTNWQLGIAMENAAGSGSLIRMLVKTK